MLFYQSEEQNREKMTNTACTRTPATNAGTRGGTLRVFEQFSWQEASSGKATLPRPRPSASNASRWAVEFGYNHAFEVYLLSKR
jgi:hypothetical protein